MTLKDFISQFSHNNQMFVENKNNYWMTYRYTPDGKVIDDDPIMDWELQHTDIADCEVICIKDVIRDGHMGSITIKVDTEKQDFQFVKDLVTLNNSPLWLYNEVHGTNIKGCCG